MLTLSLGGMEFVLEIVKYPHPALRYASRPIEQIDDALRSTVRAMFDLMYDARGIGLAANQVALPFRFFILNLTADPEQKDQEQVFINPEIVKRHSSIEDEEGCLSLPGLYAKVRRAKQDPRPGVRPGGEPGRARRRRPVQPGRPARDRPPRRQAVHRLPRAIGHATAEEKLREFEQSYLQAQRSGEIPPDEDLVRRLAEMTHPPAVDRDGDDTAAANGTAASE